VAVGERALASAFRLAELLRDATPAIRPDLNLDGGSFKSQLKRADKSGAAYAVILGDDEVASGRVGLKPLRSPDEQVDMAASELLAEVQRRLVRH
jgi:histidyl-tRNA synthetase